MGRRACLRGGAGGGAGSAAAAAAFLLLALLSSSSPGSSRSALAYVDQFTGPGSARRNLNLGGDGKGSVKGSIPPPLPDSADPYILLGLDPAAAAVDRTAVKRAYRRLVRTYHPDRVNELGSSDADRRTASENFARINAAYETLSDRGGISAPAPAPASPASSGNGHGPQRQWRRGSGYGAPGRPEPPRQRSQRWGAPPHAGGGDCGYSASASGPFEGSPGPGRGPPPGYGEATGQRQRWGQQHTGPDSVGTGPRRPRYGDRYGAPPSGSYDPTGGPGPGAGTGAGPGTGPGAGYGRPYEGTFGGGGGGSAAAPPRTSNPGPSNPGPSNPGPSNPGPGSGSGSGRPSHSRTHGGGPSYAGGPSSYQSWTEDSRWAAPHQAGSPDEAAGAAEAMAAIRAKLEEERRRRREAARAWTAQATGRAEEEGRRRAAERAAEVARADEERRSAAAGARAESRRRAERQVAERARAKERRVQEVQARNEASRRRAEERAAELARIEDRRKQQEEAIKAAGRRRAEERLAEQARIEERTKQDEAARQEAAKKRAEAREAARILAEEGREELRLKNERRTAKLRIQREEDLKRKADEKARRQQQWRQAEQLAQATRREQEKRRSDEWADQIEKIKRKAEENRQREEAESRSVVDEALRQAQSRAAVKARLHGLQQEEEHTLAASNERGFSLPGWKEAGQGRRRRGSEKVDYRIMTKANIRFIEESLSKAFVSDRIGEKQLHALIRAFRPVRFENHSTISRQGDREDCFHIIQSGRVRFEVDGNEVGAAWEGRSFGVLSMSESQITSRAATVSTDSGAVEMWRVDGNSFRDILNDPELKPPPPPPTKDAVNSFLHAVSEGDATVPSSEQMSNFLDSLSSGTATDLPIEANQPSSMEADLEFLQGASAPHAEAKLDFDSVASIKDISATAAGKSSSYLNSIEEVCVPPTSEEAPSKACAGAMTDYLDAVSTGEAKPCEKASAKISSYLDTIIQEATEGNGVTGAGIASDPFYSSPNSGRPDKSFIPFNDSSAVPSSSHQKEARRKKESPWETTLNFFGFRT